jgi:hypothetical protein
MMHDVNGTSACVYPAKVDRATLVIRERRCCMKPFDLYIQCMSDNGGSRKKIHQFREGEVIEGEVIR